MELILVSEKHIYMFEEGNKEMKELLGGKGANLAEMTATGLPVPYGFTITTKVCNSYYANNKTYPEDLEEQMITAVKKMEEKTGKKFSDTTNPLLVSVRSGAPASMPGMMDTVLNLGLNDTVVETLAKKSGNQRFAWDSYRRFITMFGDVVMGVKHAKFEKILEEVKEKNNVKLDTELTVDMLKELVQKQKALYKEETKEDFPTDAILDINTTTERAYYYYPKNQYKIWHYYAVSNIDPDNIGEGTIGVYQFSAIEFSGNINNVYKGTLGKWIMNNANYLVWMGMIEDVTRDYDPSSHNITVYNKTLDPYKSYEMPVNPHILLSYPFTYNVAVFKTDFNHEKNYSSNDPLILNRLGKFLPLPHQDILYQ